eukprot:gene14806-14940_t
MTGKIGDSFRIYGRSLGLSQAVIFGGVSYRTQIQSLYRGVDILVATPGRLLDLIKQGIISLKHVETFVIDEADQMFDMGFLKEVQKIVAELPEERQTVLFSATMPQAIAKLADKILRNPEQLRISPQSSSSEKITQQVLFVDRNNKSQALNAIIQDAATKRTIVFSRTKHGADRIVEHLLDQNIESEAIHGDKKQARVELTLMELRTLSTMIYRMFLKIMFTVLEERAEPALMVLQFPFVTVKKELF